jgi:hypothetical protein
MNKAYYIGLLLSPALFKQFPMQPLVSYPYLHLSLHQGPERAIEAQWQGFVSSALLRQATLECVQLAREHRITGWIADDRRLGAVRPVDLEWIATQVLPELIQLGLKRFARIEAVDPLNKLLIGQAQKTAAQQLPFELQSFTDLEAARAWACGMEGDSTSSRRAAQDVTKG